MKEKIDPNSVEKHSLVLAMQNSYDFDSPVSLIFDGKHIATVYFEEENNLLFLEKINLEVFGLERRGVGTIAINYLGEYFSQFNEGDDLLFLVQYDKKNTSKEFYTKIGFEDFERSKSFSKKEKEDVYFILDPFCSDAQIMYKFFKSSKSSLLD
jgi:hypothetical protein